MKAFQITSYWRVKFIELLDLVSTFTNYVYESLHNYPSDTLRKPTRFHEKILIIKSLASYYHAQTFIETGTYRASTTIRLTKYFDKIYTCEADYSSFLKCRKRLAPMLNSSVYHQNSPDFLRDISRNISNGSTSIIFLDAHYSGGKTFGESDKCPHLKELNEIKNSNLFHNSIVIIDDSRCWSTAKSDLYGWPLITALEQSISEFKYKFYMADLLILTNINPITND